MEITFSMRETLPPNFMMVFGYLTYLLKILLKITMLAYIFKMIVLGLLLRLF